MNDEKAHDFEIDRQTLLELIAKEIPEDIRLKIEAAVSSIVRIEEFKITTSNIGAADADAN